MKGHEATLAKECASGTAGTRPEGLFANEQSRKKVFRRPPRFLFSALWQRKACMRVQEAGCNLATKEDNLR